MKFVFCIFNDSLFTFNQVQILSNSRLIIVEMSPPLGNSKQVSVLNKVVSSAYITNLKYVEADGMSFM